MSADCFFPNPLRRDGTSQRQRAVRALEPGYVRIDERTLADLLVYARRFAELLRYYTSSNGRGGDWADLVEGDVAALIALIGHEDASAARAAFDAQLETARDSSTSNFLREYAGLYGSTLAAARKIDRWHGAFDPKLAVWVDLDRLMRSALNDALRDALVLSLRVEELDASIPSIRTEVAALGDAWDMSSVEPDATAFPSGRPVTAKDRSDALDRMVSVFERFHEAQVYLSGRTYRYLRETLVEYPHHPPHMALFLGFLRVYRHAQRHLNSLGAKHLDFYFEDVLKLRRKPAVSDEAHLVFKLAKNADLHRLAAGTPLKAGKDASGVELVYETTGELVVNPAVIDEENGLKTVFVDRDETSGEIVGIHAAPDADSADGEGADLEDEEGKWATLGSREMPDAELGFAIASPMFLLSEGTRKITLRFHLREPVPALADADVRTELARNVVVEFTGDGAWTALPAKDVAVIAPAEGDTDLSILAYELTVASDAGPIVPFDTKAHAGGLDTTHPVIRFLLDPDGLSAAAYRELDLAGASVGANAPGGAKEKLLLDAATAAGGAGVRPGALELKVPVSTSGMRILDFSDKLKAYGQGTIVRYRGKLYRNDSKIDDAGAVPDRDPRWEELERSFVYRFFETFRLARLDIELDVDGIRSLALENDVGVLDPAKPFMPFGPQPKAGSGFLIGSPDVFHKPVSALTLEIDWAGLPADGDLVKHYEKYDTKPSSNAYFTADATVLEAGAWRPIATDPTTLVLIDAVPANASNRRTFQVGLSAPLSAAVTAPVFQRFGIGLMQGFMRLQLNTSFLHSEYPRVLAKVLSAETPNGADLPNSPYTPLISFLSLDFEASLTIDYAGLGKADYGKRTERIFQIGPFGHREVYPIDEDPTAVGVPIDDRLVPRFGVTVRDEDDQPEVVTAEGTLLIGLAQLSPPRNLTLLIRVAEGSEDPKGDAPTVVWSYLGGDEWIDFADTEVLADGTGGLLRTGIVELAVPREATPSVTLMPGALHWLKAAVPKETRAIPKAVALHTQAATARFVDRGNDPTHLATVLPAGSIAKLGHRAAAVKSVSQPYASFGGRLAEKAPAFRVRVSERLRHKGRAVSIFDYERLVLEEFPDVYKVKCLNHSREGSEHAPGHVRLVVVPDLRNQNAVDPLRPRFSLGRLETIRARLREFASDFVTIKVTNPSYEEVRSDFAVRFHRGFDQGLYTKQLGRDLIKFLSPWLYDEAADLTFGGRVHGSAILNFVEELAYVDFVTDFKLEQILEDGEVLRDLEAAETTTSSAALVSAVDHVIAHATGSCDDHV